MIPYSKQTVTNSDIDAVVNTLKSDYLTAGPAVEYYEKALKKEFDVKYAIAVSSGTAALHLSALSLTSGITDQFIAVSPITFLSTANCILYSGNKPLFIDIEKDTANMNIKNLNTELRFIYNLQGQMEYSNEVIGAIVTDMCGRSAKWDDIQKSAKEYNIFTIRDACHSYGGSYKNEKVGNCKWADATVISTHAIKAVTTSGEGGAILTNNREVAENCRMLRNHGSKNHYMQMLGYNYRLSDIACAMGENQLKRLNEIIDSRNKIADLYNSFFAFFDGITTPKIDPVIKHAYHLYVIRIDWKKFKINSADLMTMLQEGGIQTQKHYMPIFLQPYYKKYHTHLVENYDNAMEYYTQCLSLPCHPNLSETDIEDIADTIMLILEDNKK